MALYNKKHGMTDTPTYISWNCARKRVREHKKGYENISMDPRWYNSFTEFLKDMGERPEGTTLDRIDPHGNYCKENCRWASQETQQNNRTTNVYYFFNGQKLSQAQLAKKLGIKPGNLWKQIHYQHRTIEEIAVRYGFQPN